MRIINSSIYIFFKPIVASFRSPKDNFSLSKFVLLGISSIQTNLNNQQFLITLNVNYFFFIFVALLKNSLMKTRCQSMPKCIY